MVQSVVADLAVWVITFGFGSIFSWLVWLTVRHYRYAKPAYETLAGTELDEGHLQSTDDRFEHIEQAHSDLRRRVDGVEHKVDEVDNKTDRNYRLLKKIADKADIDTILFRGSSADCESPADSDD